MNQLIKESRLNDSTNSLVSRGGWTKDDTTVPPRNKELVTKVAAASPRVLLEREIRKSRPHTWLVLRWFFFREKVAEMVCAVYRRRLY